jgi:hypothetical protein
MACTGLDIKATKKKKNGLRKRLTKALYRFMIKVRNFLAFAVYDESDEC